MATILQERPGAALQCPVSVGSVALDVRDLPRVAAFYQQAIGLEVTGGGPDRVVLGAGRTGFLELRHRPDALPRDPAAAGLYHTAFLLPARADLGRWLAHAASLGLRLDGAADHLVSEAVYLHDPEGNGIEVYADRDPSGWSWENGQVAMANSRLDMIGLRALATTPWEGAPAQTRIGHVHLQVGDAEAAKQFYAGRLGFDIVRERPEAVFLSTGGYHHHLACNSWESAGAGLRDPRRAGLAEVNFAAADTAVLREIASRAGVPDLDTTGIRDPWGTLVRFTLKSA